MRVRPSSIFRVKCHLTTIPEQDTGVAAMDPGAHYNPGTPGHVQNEWTWFVQVNVYSLITNNLIWSANTRITNPGGRVRLFEDVCNAVRSQMSADGFLQ